MLIRRGTKLCILASLLGACTTTRGEAAAGNLLANADFERPGAGVPSRWVREERVLKKGEVGVVGRVGGSRVAVLRPNTANVVAEIETHPLSIGQVLRLSEHPELRGKTLFVSAELGATAPATAALRLIAVRRGGEFIGTTLQQGESGGALVPHSDALAIPDDDRTMVIVVGLDARGTAGEVFFDNVYLGTAPRQPPASGRSGTPPPSQARIRIDASRKLRQIPATLYGLNVEWIWDGNGLWDPERSALNQGLLRLTKELKPTLIRFPGGMFADFYHWRDGIGGRGQRPSRPHLPGGPSSRNDFGTDEALELARRTGAELMITVNIATGTVAEAVEWLRYVNRPQATRGEPPTVRIWEIGNENYYRGDSPQLRQAALDGEQYTRRFLAFAEALRQADPRIRILAIAEENYEQDFEAVHPEWMRLLLSRAGHLIDDLSVHNGYAPRLEHDAGWDLRTVYGAMLAAPLPLRRSLDRLSRQIREHAPAHASRIGIAITEWAPSFQLDLKGRFLDHPKTLGSALFVASNLMNYIEHPDVRIANYFKLNDRLWQGLIGVRGGEFAPTAPYHAFRLFRERFGSVLIETHTESPTWNAPGAGFVPAQRDVPYLQVISSLSGDGRRLHVMVVNKSFDQPIAARIEIDGFAFAPVGRAVVLSGTGIDAHTGTELFTAPGIKWAPQAVDEANPRFRNGGAGEITLTERPVAARGQSFDYSFDKHSVTAIELEGVAPRR